LSIFSDRIKILRLENDFTQKYIAEVLDITDRYYQKYEYGKVKPSQANLIKLADFYNVSTDYLLGRTDVKSVCIADQNPNI